LAKIITLAETYAQIMAGLRPDLAFKQFADAFHRASTVEMLVEALAESPPLTGNRRLDALAAAAAEYLAKQHRLGPGPSWAYESERFLDRPWHTCDYDDHGLREYLSWASPAEFTSRNIFTDERPLGVRGGHLMVALKTVLRQNAP
jgi:hypothetical protein